MFVCFSRLLIISQDLKNLQLQKTSITMHQISLKAPNVIVVKPKSQGLLAFCFGFFLFLFIFTLLLVFTIPFIFNILLFKQRTIYYRSRQDLVSGTFRVHKWKVQTSITGHWFCGGRQRIVLRILFRTISRSSVLKVLQENQRGNISINLLIDLTLTHNVAMIVILLLYCNRRIAWMPLENNSIQNVSIVHIAANFSVTARSFWKTVFHIVKMVSYYCIEK